MPADFKKFGYCFLACTAVRKEPESNAEQVTQLLFGDVVKCLEIYNPNKSIASCWLKIKNIADDYIGWIDIRSVILMDKKQKDSKFLTKKFISKVNIDGEDYNIPLASHIIDTNWEIEGHKFAISEHDITKIYNFSPEKIIKVSKQFFNCPYLWGGKSVFGLDCSGFTQNVFSFFGVNLQRDASKQANQFQNKNFNEIKAGDLCFFGDNPRRITHVGIYIGDNLIIHCSSRVRIDYIDKKGILPKESLSGYSHLLQKISSVI